MEPPEEMTASQKKAFSHVSALLTSSNDMLNLKAATQALGTLDDAKTPEQPPRVKRKRGSVAYANKEA
eukprot:CAMPEP_0175170054 /NCGR_PEP_ID=MMETSP0087-20121206/29979_1 /TAXON_ID=136419 /ORGANISM="Unknown Unknown, Strain D1" /LENGTH=67 /DNA_ID=CAMNT_0016460601 /DNA_START=76 /DNA_END=275 /DNA_ORIENTATION=-